VKTTLSLFKFMIFRLIASSSLENCRIYCTRIPK